MLGTRARKFALTAHVVSSVGWLGAAGVFLALGVVGLASGDPEVVRAVYLAMDAADWAVLVPLALASLATGLVQSLGTRWGLFRHYWVVVKLAMTILGVLVVVLYTQTLSYQADLARASAGADLDALRSASPVLHSAIGMALLLVAVTLSVYKPRGETRHGQRARARQWISEVP
ncbi:hypothetical protein [Sporichthya sp.]|uniref:hypothetical protein n=1 Tax=Sporichthya sp. TaxID=65475 RepID=UPI0018500F89|nr:hypothetical protein [Sporichthya sp.]MBA3742030.1 DUF2269 domain-containing protein [Sporichthya sp.]